MNIRSTPSPTPQKSGFALCPHGGTPGACPQCMGGGGGGGAAKSRASSGAGLMSWGQAWSAWTALRQAETQNKELHKAWLANGDRTDHEAAAARFRAEWNVALSGRLSQAAGVLLGGMFKTLLTMLPRLEPVTVENNTFRSLSAPRKSPLQELRSVADKVAASLGDARMRLLETIEQAREGLKQLLEPLRAQWVATLAQMTNLVESLRQELRSVWRSLEQGAKSLYESVLGWLENLNPDSEKSKARKKRKKKE